MKKVIAVSALGALALAGGIAMAQTGETRAPGAPTTRADATARADARFDRLDADKDGKLTPEDRALRGKERADRMFAALDADKNGQVSRAEFDAAREKRMERRKDRAEARGERGRHGMGRMAHRGFGRDGMRGKLDANGDGTVTRAEFQAPALAMFDRVDANKDGTITLEERQAVRAAWRAKRSGS
ncbi:EF-hand domain-containing protein [Sphingomonas colocasiae]|uniref:EF-hand domain-containing protein n=1 Tax=Sphingomonas colocasiae TaxID=1848973 RepID=A0ABS7PLS5_9SPHN|nr:EF-hand domain-containing protein [Sphingomonas colocasiae]MBY8822183.1 hypothetical protein [Sphingomonas colocasiae]